MPSGWQMDKQGMAHPYKGILTITRNEVLTHAAAWMSPENIILSERSQVHKMTYHMIQFL